MTELTEVTTDEVFLVLSEISGKLDILYDLLGHQVAIIYILLLFAVVFLLCKFYYFALELFETI